MAVKQLKKQLIASILSVAVAFVALASSTYAWYVSNNTVDATTSTIAAKTDLADQKKHTYLRTLFPSLLITGPFSIVFGFNGGLMALNDRLKLRSMVVGEKKDMVYIASEETAIRAMEPDAENIWAPAGGEPVIVTVKEGVLL